MTTMIRALQTQVPYGRLPEPNLHRHEWAASEFPCRRRVPVPIVQGGGDKSTVTIVFKEYGVRLNFKPTIIDEDHIRLELEPEGRRSISLTG